MSPGRRYRELGCRPTKSPLHGASDMIRSGARVLFDDSFRPGFYLTRSFVGDELNVRILDSNVQAQQSENPLLHRAHLQSRAALSGHFGCSRRRCLLSNQSPPKSPIR
jgi:hypothetical protein